MSWLTDLGHKLGHFADTTWDHNRNFVGNAIKNVSPLLAFTPLGPLGSGAAAALGQGMEKGSNLGSILKSGVSNAAIGAGAHSLYGAARGAMAGAGSAGAGGAGGSNFAAGAANAAPAPPVSIGGISMAAPQAATLPSMAAGGGSGLSSQLMSGLRGAGSFLKDNASTIGSTGNALLNAREQGQQMDLKSQQFDFEKQQYADEQKRRAQIAQMLGPLYRQMLARQGNMAPNPYAQAPQAPSPYGGP